MMPGELHRAVLETSFWVNAARAGVVGTCLDIFTLVVPRAVEAEILATDPLVATRDYEYRALFRHLRAAMEAAPEPEPEPIPHPDAGEAAAIPVAAALRLPLLVNDRHAIRLARNYDVRTLDVPGLIVLLVSRGTLASATALDKLSLLESTTARELIQRSRRHIERSRSVRL